MKRRDFAKMMTAAVAGVLAGAKVLPALAEGNSSSPKDSCSGKDGCQHSDDDSKSTGKDTCKSADGKDTCRTSDDSSKDSCKASDDSGKTKESCGAK